jgi:glycerol uptake facilitator-like aquaporin
MLQQGFDVYLLDWGKPGLEDRNLQFDDYVLDYMPRAMPLVALILTFGPVSGAHSNPAVTLADASQKGIGWNEVHGYVIAQILGAFFGVACAHLMFGLALFSVSRHPRSGISQAFSESIATFGLMSVIWGCSRLYSSVVPFAVAAYITAAYWFTASTSFANPAVTWQGRRRTTSAESGQQTFRLS